MSNRLPYAAMLEDILRTEISVLSDLYSIQKNMYECVLIRDWIRLQDETTASEKMVQQFLEAEHKRIALLKSAYPALEGSKDFYQVTAVLCESDRTCINSLFREMKRLLLLSKTENEVFNTYITNARTIVSGMIETVVPARRNKIYTRHGALAAANVESLVVNRSF
jgi:hypothetical protein